MKQLSIFLLLFAGYAVAAEFPPLDKLMSEEDMRNTGVDQLSEQEREVLREWLWRYTDRDSEFYRRNAEAPATVEEGDESSAIRSHILGEFKGWDGQTTFKLANGQVWQQRRRARYSYRATNPKVRIDKNLFGFFELTIENTGRSIQVKRIK